MWLKALVLLQAAAFHALPGELADSADLNPSSELPANVFVLAPDAASHSSHGFSPYDVYQAVFPPQTIGELFDEVAAGDRALRATADYFAGNGDYTITASSNYFLYKEADYIDQETGEVHPGSSCSKLAYDTEVDIYNSEGSLVNRYLFDRVESIHTERVSASALSSVFIVQTFVDGTYVTSVSGSGDLIKLLHISYRKFENDHRLSLMDIDHDDDFEALIFPAHEPIGSVSVGGTGYDLADWKLPDGTMFDDLTEGVIVAELDGESETPLTYFPSIELK